MDEQSPMDVFVDQLVSDWYVVAGVLILAALLPVLINAGVALVRLVWRLTVRRLKRRAWRDDAAM
jgi:hypothetical protein